MKKSYKIALITSVILLIVGLAGYEYYLVISTPKNTFNLKAEYKVQAEDLFKQFETNEDSANAKYLDKIIEVEGKILSVKEMSGSYQVSLVDENFGVTCLIDSNYAVQQKKEILNLKAGDEVKIKGKCNGYLSDVKLDRCVLSIEK